MQQCRQVYFTSSDCDDATSSTACPRNSTLSPLTSACLHSSVGWPITGKTRPTAHTPSRTRGTFGASGPRAEAQEREGAGMARLEAVFDVSQEVIRKEVLEYADQHRWQLTGDGDSASLTF